MKHKLFFNKLWLRVGMLVAIMTTTLSGTVWAETVTFNFPDIATAESWENGKAYTSYTISPITIQALGGGNNGKYYTSSNGSWRMYSGGKVQISAEEGNTITSVTSNPSCDFTIDNGVATFSPTGRTDFKIITVTYTATGGTPTPSISAENVNVAYDATSGSIAYSLTNEVSGGEVTASTTSDWLSVGTVAGGSVPFTCSANTNKDDRTATVTLTYTYSTSETVTKSVTVTQTGNPNIVDNISDITAAGTYTVKGTIVAKSQRGFIVGDGTGYVYYYNQNYTQSDYNIGDMVKLAGSVVVYGGVYEFNSSTTVTAATESNYVAEEPTVLTGSQMDTRVGSTTPAELSTYVQYEGVLTVDGTHYNITSIDGASTAKGSISYPLSTDFTSLNGKTVKVTGYYVGVSSSQYYNTMLGSIEEVTNADPVISASNVTLAYDATSGEITYTIANPTDATLTATSSASWISNITVGEESVTFTTTANNGTTDREATITLSYTGAEDVTVTVTQGHYVADYATLPFEFDGGRADIEDTAGLTQSGLGSDYNSSPKLKFDGTGDELILKINERPGVLSFDIKGNTFSGGTFTVQTSEDGTTYTDLKTYTELGDTQNESFNYLGENVRYIKWIYTNKSSGNVALGNINLAAYSTAPVINAEDVSIASDATSGEIAYTITNPASGVTLNATTDADWVSGITVTAEKVTFTTTANTGAERTATFTLTYTGATDKTVTVTQAAYVAPITGDKYVKVTSTADLTDGQYLIVYEDGSVAFNGGLETLDAVSNTIDVIINNSEIVATSETKAAEFTIAAIEGSYSIKSASGQYIYHSGTKNGLSSSDEAQANDITFDEDGNVLITVGDYTLKYNKNSDQTRFRYFGSGQQSIQLYKFVAAPASQSVTVSSAGYATIVAEADLEIPAGVEVFAVTVNGAATSAHLEAIEDGIPEGEAVLVKASADTYEFPYATEAVAALTIDNDLKAATTAFNPSAANTIYCLAQKSGTVGFYPVATTVTIPAGKAYLETTSGEAPVKGFYGFDDDATGIEAIDHSPLTIDGGVYNLSGQQIVNGKSSNRKLPRGIYIVGGKKILY